MKLSLPGMPSGIQFSDEELSNTELRNWRSIQAELAKKGNQFKVKFPVIADFYMSKQFGTSWQSEMCQTITETRARARGFWVIDK